MEAKECSGKRWALVNSIEISVETQEEEEKEEEEEEEEALSLCDLPLNIHDSRQEKEERNENNHQEDFDFCSLSQESEMCAADEVFHQGQILPLRHLIRPIRRSESSRSSSTSSSRHSSTSGGGGGGGGGGRLPPRNLFHSHPSPSPKLQFHRNRINHRKFGAWSVFRVGLVAAPPEIAFGDLKNRVPSKSSSGEKKNKQWDFLSCKCSFDAVGTVPSEVVLRRNASDGELQDSSPKKRLSHHRTFEWLKQLQLHQP